MYECQCLSRKCAQSISLIYKLSVHLNFRIACINKWCNLICRGNIVTEKTSCLLIFLIGWDQEQVSHLILFPFSLSLSVQVVFFFFHYHCHSLWPMFFLLSLSSLVFTLLLQAAGDTRGKMYSRKVEERRMWRVCLILTTHCPYIKLHVHGGALFSPLLFLTREMKKKQKKRITRIVTRKVEWCDVNSLCLYVCVYCCIDECIPSSTHTTLERRLIQMN